MTRQPELGEPVTIGWLPTFTYASNRNGWPHRTAAGRDHPLQRVDAGRRRRFQRAVDELRDTSGMVLDLRGNPGGLAAMIMGISGTFP